MIKRSVSNIVGKSGKVNVVMNVEKVPVRQIVGDSAYRVDRSPMTGYPAPRLGISRSFHAPKAPERLFQ